MITKVFRNVLSFGLAALLIASVSGSKAFGDIIYDNNNATFQNGISLQTIYDSWADSDNTNNIVLQVADKLFWGFDVENQGFDLTKIYVKPEILNYQGEWEYGLLFQLTGSSTVQNGESRDLILEFGVRTESGEDLIHDAYMSVVGGATNTGARYNISEDIYSDEDLQNILADLYVFKNGGLSQTSDIEFFDPQDVLYIRKNIQLDSDRCATSEPCLNQAFISHFSQLFSQESTTGDSTGSTSGTIPEPASMVLLGIGLASFGVIRKKQLSK